MSEAGCRLADGFPASHKAIMRLLLAAVVAVAAWAVFRQGGAWGWAYLAAVALGQGLLVLPALCGHCPYPHQFNDCLLAPPALMRLLPYRGSTLRPWEKLAIALGLLPTIVMPLPWLARDPWLLALFVALTPPFVLYFPLYMCKRCRHAGCPANRAGA